MKNYCREFTTHKLISVNEQGRLYFNRISAGFSLDKFPHTAGTHLQHSDIHPKQSNHVETVALISKVNGCRISAI
jgi:hypothetical protein